MGDISVGSGTTNTHTMPVKPMAGQALSKVDELNVAVSTKDGDYKVSAEAQYVFEMQKYLFSLDSAEQEKALEFLAQSNEPLQHNVIETFRSAQENRKAFAEGRFRVVDDTELRESQRKLLDTGFVLDGTTEIGVRPNGINVFILDGKQNYFPARGTEDNPALTKQLDALENASSGLLRNRDTANLFGAVSNALNYSEHILLSADDVLHYNYAIEKARKTIEFVNPPAELKAAITDLLERGIAWQNAKQTRAITDSRQLMGNSRVGHHAAEVVRMGTAAQAFNQTLLGLFKSKTVSLLTSDALIKRVIVEQPDLIRFSPTKIDEALAYYRQDDVLYDAALNRGFSLPVEEWKSPTFELDQKLIDASKHYALKMIKEIQGYVSTQQT